MVPMADKLHSDSHLHGWCWDPAVLHFSVLFLCHQIPSETSSADSTRCRRSVACAAIAICSLRGATAHYGTSITLDMIPNTDNAKMRIIFRLVEYSQGFKSGIPVHEVYQYCLDSAPMLVALVILNVFHPGRVMRGPNNELPSRKERKVEGVHTKSEKVNMPSNSAV